MTALVIALLVFALGAGLVFGLAVFATRLPGILLRRRLESRIRNLGRPAGDDERADAASLIKTRPEGPLPSVDRLVAQTMKGSALGRWLEQAGTKVSISGVLLIAAGLAALMALVGAAVTRQTWGAAAGAVIGVALPFVVLRAKRTRRLRKFEEMFPEALDLMARAARAGHAFTTGLKMAADEVDDPVGPEFRKTFDEQNYGLPLQDALRNLSDRVPLIDVRFFATAVLIQRETGGNLAEILDNLAHVVRERFKILRQVRVYTAHGRLTSYVLLALPAAVAGALSFINPEHMNLLFRERMGQTMLVGAIVMQVLGYVWIQRIVKIEV